MISDGERARLYDIAEQMLLNHPVMRTVVAEIDDHTRYGIRSAAQGVVNAILGTGPSATGQAASEVAREMLAEFKPHSDMGSRFDHAVVPIRRTEAWRARLGVSR